MNEALISGKLDVAFMGIPPVLIAIDKGVEYRIANGICVPPAELLVRVDSEIKSLSDIQPNHKIAVPGVGSIQHIMLAMAAKKQLGSGNALDNNIVAMANPDAYASLISKTDIVGHFASMPYIDLEAKAGMVSVLDAKDALGSGASIVCVTTPQFENEKELSLALKNALSHAIDLINLRDDRVIEIIASTEKISKEAARMYLDWPGTVYALEVYSISALGSFMEGAGYLKHPYPGFNKVTWQGAKEASFD
ncbi:MAG: ABC transporter substrate-binding protein [Bacteroidetes bacterium HGW-Bacteroidetes-17]|nr:MAG: ABC transporter substrate-binding protein [Bacteroidetes bacterium HGW-Bacteroidetes-17]